MTATTLEKRIAEDLKKAMLAKDEVARDTLRMLKADLLKEQVKVDDAADPQTAVDELAVVLRAVKTRRDSADEYARGGRPELAEKERAEIAVLEAYLPKSLSEEEAREALVALVEELGLTEKRQMGQLIKAAMARYPGQIDGKLASKLAGSLLG